MAGLLPDYLFSSEQFGGPGGPRSMLDGLPDWLKEALGANAQAQPQNAPLPAAGPMPRPSPFGQQQPPTPAQLAPGGGLPRTPLGESPKVEGLGNRLYEAAGGFFGGEGLIGGAANAIHTLATGDITNPYALAKRQLLERYSALQRDFGLTEPQARAAVQDPKIMEAFIPTIAPKFEQFKHEQAYGGFNPATGRTSIQGAVPKYEKLSQGEIGGYSVPPGYSGAPMGGAPGVPARGPNGPAAPSAGAPGFNQNAGNPAKPQEIDAGTHTILWDPQLRREVGRIPKNVQEAKAEQVAGELRGTANVNLPDTIANATEALGLIDKIENHPGKYWGTGFTGAFPSMPGTKTKDFDIAVDQLKSKTFLNAYTQLRGSGAISDQEGKVATAAQARLNQAGSIGEFNAALKELRDVMKNGIERARLKAGRINTMNVSPPAGYVVQ